MKQVQLDEIKSTLDGSDFIITGKFNDEERTELTRRIFYGTIEEKFKEHGDLIDAMNDAFLSYIDSELLCSMCNGKGKHDQFMNGGSIGTTTCEECDGYGKLEVENVY